MRSVHKQPGTPWPHEMVINVDHPNHLLTLLYVRDTWNIAREANLPELFPAPAPGVSALPGRPSPETWGTRWNEAWHTAWDWYVQGADGDVIPITTSPRGSGTATTNPVMPPMWETAYGSEGIDREALWEWIVSLQDAPTALAETPERRNLSDLIVAWRSGIDSMIVLPYADDFSKRITTRHLLVSTTTRNNPVLYGQALRNATDPSHE